MSDLPQEVWQSWAEAIDDFGAGIDRWRTSLRPGATMGLENNMLVIVEAVWHGLIDLGDNDKTIHGVRELHQTIALITVSGVSVQRLRQESPP